jgi:hypothetical protein
MKLKNLIPAQYEWGPFPFGEGRKSWTYAMTKYSNHYSLDVLRFYCWYAKARAYRQIHRVVINIVCVLKIVLKSKFLYYDGTCLVQICL